MDRKQDQYRAFAEASPNLPLFCQPFWLDILAGARNWSAATAEKGHETIGAWPYYLKRKYGLQTISMPLLTPSMGPHLVYPAGQKQASRLTYEHEVYGELLRGLPKVSHFSQYLPSTATNVLPCIWQGFQAVARYTYLLPDLTNLNTVFANFKSNIKTDIRKAQKQVTVAESEDVEAFEGLFRKTFQRQSVASPISLKLMTQLNHACAERNCRKIFLAKDEQGKLHAGAYMVWDSQQVYYLMGGADPALRTSGAGSLVVWEAIQFASKMGQPFNFEGSMLPTVEPYFRAFGGLQVPYFHLTRTPSRFLRIVRSFRSKSP